RELQANIDADDCLDGAAGLHKSSNAAPFDGGSEEARHRSFLAVRVPKPDHQRAEKRSHNDETHVAIILSQPLTLPPGAPNLRFDAKGAGWSIQGERISRQRADRCPSITSRSSQTPAVPCRSGTAGGLAIRVAPGVEAGRPRYGCWKQATSYWETACAGLP